MIAIVLAFHVVADTAVVAPRENVDAVVAACPADWACVAGDRVLQALADADTLGLKCDANDDACWRRFLAAEGFARVVVTSGVDVLVVDEAARRATGEPAAALNTVVHPPLKELEQPPPSTPPPPTTTATPYVVAGIAGAVAVAAAVAAEVVSAQLDHDMTEATAGRATLEDYDARNALFLGLAGASGVAVVVAAGALVVLQ